MGFARARLLVAAALLAAWLGWLGYQAWTRGRDYPILSHSQFLVSALDVVAEVRAGADGRPDPVVKVRQVHWPARRDDLVGQSITAANLPSAQGFRGPGAYILPLVPEGREGEYRVAGMPRSPGFEPEPVAPRHVIYAVEPITLQQLAVVPKPAGPPGQAARGEKPNPGG